MKWLIEIIRDENGDIIDRKPKFRTDETAKPRGGEYIFVEDFETKYPLVDVDVDGNVSIIEDTAKKDFEEGLILKLERMEFGKRIIGIISLRNDAKSLTQEQIQQLPVTYGDARAALQDGSIATARVIIDALVPDGTILTQDDKDAVIGEIDNNLTRLGYNA